MKTRRYGAMQGARALTDMYKTYTTEASGTQRNRAPYIRVLRELFKTQRRKQDKEREDNPREFTKT